MAPGNEKDVVEVDANSGDQLPTCISIYNYIYIYIHIYIYTHIYIYVYIPSWELTYPLPEVLLKMIFLSQRSDMLVPQIHDSTVA